MIFEHNYPQFTKWRSQWLVISSSFYKLVDVPIEWAIGVHQRWSSHNSLQEDYKHLQSYQLLLQGRLQKLNALEVENQRLRLLLRSSQKMGESFLVASLLHVNPDPFTHQVVLNKGSQDGIVVGQPIIDTEGVFGSVILVNQSTCHAMLATDASHAIPVENLRNGVRAIALGTGALNTLELDHVPNTVDISVGDVFVTSGLGGRYPAGFPVGSITEVTRHPGQSFAKILLTPKAHLDSSRQVLLVQTNADQVVNES